MSKNSQAEVIPLFPLGKLLKGEDVAQILGISAKTVSKKVFEKKIPYIKLGIGRNAPVRFDPGELNKWIKNYSVFPISTNQRYVNLENHFELEESSRETQNRFNSFIQSL